MRVIREDWLVIAHDRDSQLRLGATRMPDLGGSCPVYADPAGHPFCLCAPGQ